MVNKCGSCDLALKRGEPNVSCSACFTAFHEKCSALPNQDFTLLTRKTSAIKWFCRICDPQVVDILTNLEKFKKASTELKALRAEVDKKLSSFESRLKTVEDSCMNQQVEQMVEKVIEKKLPTCEAITERELVEKKKNNLIYFNLPESSSENPEERINHDFECFSKVLGPSVDPTDISNIFRIGKKCIDKPRPLIVRFQDLKSKQKYCDLSFDRSLKLLWNNESIKIGSAHDKTKTQREASKKRYETRNNAQNTDQSHPRDFQREVQGVKPTWAKILRGMK